MIVNRNSEDSLLIHIFQSWQRLSGNPIKSSTIELNRYLNIYSFRPQFNQCFMNLPNCFPRRTLMSSPSAEVVPETSPPEETNFRFSPSHKTKLRS